MEFGIIAAMQKEAALLLEKMQEKTETVIGGVTYTAGVLCGRTAVVAVCGVGKVFSALCAQAMILRFSPRYIINTGVAGSLSTALHIGDLVIADGAVQHDMDTSAVGDPVGLISGINMIELPADTKIADELDRVCAAANVNHRLGVIASGDQFVHTTERRVWIVSTFNASAVEMEAAAIAQVCFVNKIPFAAIRVISDEASGDVKIDYMTFVKAAAATSSDIALRWLRARA